MTDLPPGEWSTLVVGHQWPASTSLAVLAAATTSRQAIGQAFEGYADELASIRNGPLATQNGLTADHTMTAFLTGEGSARNTSERNSVGAAAYASAHNSTSELRSNLREIAQRANDEIRKISASKEPAPTKLDKVVAVVMAGQSEANLKAAIHGSTILGTIQKVLDITHSGQSAREFVRANGIEVSTLYSGSTIDTVRDQTSTLLSRPTSSRTGTESLAAAAAAGDTTHLGPPSSESISRPDSLRVTTSNGNTESNTSVHPPHSADLQFRRAVTAGDTSGLPHLRGISAIAPAVTSDATSATPTISNSASSLNAAGHQSMASAASIPIGDAPPISPADLTRGFSEGSQAGAPISAGTEAVSANGVHSAHQTPTHNPPMPAPAVAPVAPMAIGPEVAVAHAPSEAAPPTVLAAPQPTVQAAAPAPPSISVTPSAAPAGALPTYGADLKAPAATIPAASPAPAAPTSAHLSGSATNTLSQPSVVRHQSAPSAATTATALTERAVAATTTGAIGGAATSQATAQQRLRHLLAFVARQAPELGWTIGERDSGITLLTTDLASGWIPPNIQIPSGVTILEPAKRSGSLAGMLGATILTASHAPGQHVPLDNADAPTISTRPRTTADVEDLHWKLAQATKWRDGLPRLAHTLARAISSGTGYLNSEVQLLQDALHSVANRAVATYPNTEPDLIGNWQLLATIEALINNETNCANYHLAWFRALAPTGVSSR